MRLKIKFKIFSMPKLIILIIKLLMEEGGSKAEFPLTHQLFMIGVGDLPLLY